MKNYYIVNSRGQYWDWVARKWIPEKKLINGIAIYQEKIISQISDPTAHCIDADLQQEHYK
jgi:hypothetical protein